MAHREPTGPALATMIDTEPHVPCRAGFSAVTGHVLATGPPPGRIRTVLGPHLARIIISGHPGPQRINAAMSYARQMEGITKVEVEVARADDQPTPGVHPEDFA